MYKHTVSRSMRRVCFCWLILACFQSQAQTGTRLLQAPLSESIEPVPAVPSSASGTNQGATHRISVLGTGFAIGGGYILTAHHVVNNRTALLIGPGVNGQWIAADLIQSDPRLDLALLHAKVTVPGLTIAKNTQVPTGLEISVIGFPQPAVQGLSAKITQGIINGTRSSRIQGQSQTLLQISSEITTGNSGSPVLAPDGSVVGIVQRKVNAQKVAEKGNDLLINVAYALPSSQILQFLADSPASVSSSSLILAKVLRPYEIYEASHPAIFSIASRQTSINPANPPTQTEAQPQ